MTIALPLNKHRSPPLAPLLPEQWWRLPLSKIAALAPIQPLPLPLFRELGVTVDIKREDLLCPYIGGNKLYKLHYHLKRANALGAHTLASFGGAYSNHLYALARVGQLTGVGTIGVVRGERPRQLSATLRNCEVMGMQLQFVSRSDYRNKHQFAQQALWGLKAQGIYCIPEGGGGIRGALGMAAYGRALSALCDQQRLDYDHLLIACGTGASAAGLAAVVPVHTCLQGILVLKGSSRLLEAYRVEMVRTIHHLQRFLSQEQGSSHLANYDLAKNRHNWKLQTPYHQGGYGPMKAAASEELQRLLGTHDLPLDPVYTGKVLLALKHLLLSDIIKPAERVLVIHSGGLQGISRGH